MLGAQQRWQQTLFNNCCSQCSCPDRHNVLMVKRIIALEGDWLLVPGAADAQKIPKARRQTLRVSSPLSVKQWVLTMWPLSQGHIWIEGDNAAVSEDSRTKFGPVPAALVQGRLVSVLWPPRAVGSVSTEFPQNRLLVMNKHAFQARDEL